MILIVTFPDNEHVEQVRRHLRVEHTLLDLADFPERVSLVARTDGCALRLVDGRLLDLDGVRSVWFRRVRPYSLSPRLSPVGARFAWSECHEAMEGVWHALPAFWMNPPLADHAAQRKILQLRVAARVGLAVPETLVTNDPVEAGEFLDRVRPDRVVRKAFRNVEEAPRQTAIVDESARAVLPLVRHAPVILQRFVPAAADLRVIAVGEELFTALIVSDADHQVDYRPGLGTATMRAHRLPDDVDAGLRALMRELGLVYGAIDLRLTPEGEYVFLEVNPAGEYLYVSSRVGLAVPQAIAATLTRGRAEPLPEAAAPIAHDPLERAG